MRVFRTSFRHLIILVVALDMVVGTHIMATTEEPPKIDAKLEVIVPDDIQLEKPFEVTFTFEARENLLTLQDKPLTAKIRAPENAKYLSGDTIWQGALDVGESLSITASYEITEALLCRFHGILEVYSGEKPIELESPDPRFKKLSNGAVSRLIGYPEWERKRTQSLLIVTDSGTVPAETTLEPPPTIVSGDDRKIRLTPSYLENNSTDSPKNHTENDRTPPLPINLNHKSPDTLRVSHWPGRVCSFVTESSANLELELVKGKAQYTKKGNNQVAFRLESDTAIFFLQAGNMERVLMLMRYNRIE